MRLCELERIERERRNVERRIRLARFPQTKSFDTFDFTAQPSLNKSLVLELSRCQWIDTRHNCIALGPSGTGKTHVALALGLAACQKGYSVAFTTAAALVHAPPKPTRDRLDHGVVDPRSGKNPARCPVRGDDLLATAALADGERYLDGDCPGGFHQAARRLAAAIPARS